VKAAAPEPTWAKAGAAASYGSASHHNEIRELLILVFGHRTRNARHYYRTDVLPSLSSKLVLHLFPD
jgi:hypothetical protein